MSNKNKKKEVDIEKEFLDEIRRSGFLLERETAAIFKNEGFTVDQNQLFPVENSTEHLNKLTEIDVFAWKKNSINLDEGYLVECKGARSDDRLVLMPSPIQTKSFPSLTFKDKKIELDSKANIFCDNTSITGPVLCNTGDFFQLNNGKFKKCSREEDKTNLYKGINQIYYALNAIFWTHRKSYNIRITPLIVTNSQIHVVQFQENSIHTTADTKVVKWAAYETSLTYNHGRLKIASESWISADNRNIESVEPYLGQKRIPLIWIVNVHSLTDFLTSDGKRYEQRKRTIQHF